MQFEADRENIEQKLNIADFFYVEEAVLEPVSVKNN